jgi:hypothetical protein
MKGLMMNSNLIMVFGIIGEIVVFSFISVLFGFSNPESDRRHG